jgi:hypothetical protein
MPGQAFSKLLGAAVLSEPSAPPAGNHVNNWRKPRPPRSYFFFHVYFLFFKFFFFCKMSRFSITYKHDFYGGVEGEVTGGSALLCCPQEDIKSFLSEPVYSRLCASAWALTIECPSDPRTPSGTPGPLGTVPWRWGSLGMGGPLLPTAPTPRERERRGGQPAQRWSAEEGQEGSADGEAEATQELILAVVQEGAEGQCQGQGRKLLLQRGAHDPVTVHRACGPRAGQRLGGLMCLATHLYGSHNGPVCPKSQPRPLQTITATL